jgi:DNA-binding MarR family transcriptional regulator
MTSVANGTSPEDPTEPPPAQRSLTATPNTNSMGPRSLGWAISRLSRYVEIALFEIDLSLIQHRVLLQLAQGPESAKSLAERLTVTGPNLSAVVNGLVQRGLVTRTQSATDRRRVSVALTDKGRRLLELAEERITTRLFDIASHFPEASIGTAALASLAMWNTALDPFRSRWLARDNAIRLGHEPLSLRNERQLGTLALHE